MGDMADLDAWSDDGMSDVGRMLSDSDRRVAKRMAGISSPRRPILPMELAREAMAEQVRADGRERFGSQPPVGTVLRWTGPGRYELGKVLTYLALRVENGWFSSIQNEGRMSWPQVVARIGDAPCSVAVSWREIPAPEPEPSGDQSVADWAAQFLADSTPVDLDDDASANFGGNAES